MPTRDLVAPWRVLIAITVTVGLLAGCGSGGGSTGGTTASSGPQRKGPAGPPAVAAKVRAFKIGGDPWSVAAVDGVVWVASRGDGRLLRIARSGARLGRPTRLGHLGTLVNALAVSAGGTWAGYAKNAGYVVRLDPASGALGQRVSVGIDAKHIAIGGGAAYASYLTNIARVPLAGGLRRAVDVGRTPNALLYVAGRLWASAWNGRTRSDGVVLELNPRSLRTAKAIPATDPADRSSTSEESEPFGLAAGAGSVWAAVAGDLGEVIRIDQRSGRETARIRVGTSYPFAVAFAAGNVWALDYFDNTLTRIDPHTNRVTGRLRVGPPRNSDNIAPNVQAGLAASGRFLWVTDEDSATLTRVVLR